MTFAEFQATGRDVADLSSIPVIAGCGDFEGREGRVYAGDLYIECETAGTMCPVYTLTIGNSSESTDDLESLERQLYAWGLGEEIL